LKELNLHDIIADAIMQKAHQTGFLHCDAHNENVLFEDSEYEPSGPSTFQAVHLIDWARSEDVRHVSWAFGREARVDMTGRFTPIKCPEGKVQGEDEEDEAIGSPAAHQGPYASQRQEVLKNVRHWFPVNVGNEYGEALCA